MWIFKLARLSYQWCWIVGSPCVRSRASSDDTGQLLKLHLYHNQIQPLSRCPNTYLLLESIYRRGTISWNKPAHGFKINKIKYKHKQSSCRHQQKHSPSCRGVGSPKRTKKNRRSSLMAVPWIEHGLARIWIGTLCVRQPQRDVIPLDCGFVRRCGSAFGWIENLPIPPLVKVLGVIIIIYLVNWGQQELCGSNATFGIFLVKWMWWGNFT